MAPDWIRAGALVLFFGISGCECDRIDPPIREVACDHVGSVEPILEPQDPCAHGEVVFDPMTLRRDGGQSEHEVEFAMPGAGTVCVRVTNGDTSGSRTSAAWVSIDGDAQDGNLLGPSAFSQRVSVIERTTQLSAGTHHLRVRLASRPDSMLTVEMLFVADHTEEEVTAVVQAADLRQATCEEWNRELSLLTAEEAEAYRQQQVLLGVGPGELRFRTNAYGIPRRLDPLPRLDVGQAAGDSAETIARKWLDHYGALMGLTDPSIQLQLDYVKPSKHGAERVRFRQQIAGLPVDNAFLEVGVGDNEVRRIVGNVVRPPSDMLATIDATAATALVQDLLPGSEVIRGPELVVFDRSLLTGEADSRLAWRLVSTDGTLDGSAGVWLDADSGELLHWQGPSEDAFDSELYRGDNVERDPGDPEPVVALQDTENDFFACTGDDEEWCGIVEQRLALLDLEWRVDYGRDGWSDTGLAALPGEPGSEIPADDNYRVLMDPNENSGTWFMSPALEDDSPGSYDFPSRSGRRADGRFTRLNSLSSFASHDSDNEPSADVIRHEFGHALFQVELGQRGTLSEARPPASRFLHEHAAEFWAISNRDDDSPFFHTSQEGTTGIDQTRLTCSVVDALDNLCYSGPPYAPVRNDLCATYEHMNGYVDDLTLDNVEHDWVHRNACLLDRVAFRALASSTHFAHGVSSRGVGDKAARFIFYELLTEHSTVTDDIHDYADNYRSAVATLVAKCDPVLGTGGEACPENRDPLRDGMSPLWGVGFYSQPIDVTGLDSAIQTRYPPGVVAIGSTVYLFYADLASHLQMAEFADPIDRSPPVTIRDITSALPGAPELGYFNVAVEDEDTILVAFVTRNDTGPNLGVARVHLAPFSVAPATTAALSAPGFRAEADRLAIISHAGGWLLVYSSDNVHDLMQIRNGDAVPQLLPKGVPQGQCGAASLPPDQTTRGSDPVLFRDPFFDTVNMIYLDQQGQFGFQQYQLLTRRLNANGLWCYPLEVGHLEPGGRDTFPPNEGNLLTPHQDLITISRHPPAVAYFPPASFLPPVFPRLHIFSSAPPSGASTPSQVRQLSLGPPIAPEGFGMNRVWNFQTSTRNVPIDQGGASGVAVTPYHHALHGPILLVYHRGAGILRDHLLVLYKRSD